MVSDSPVLICPKLRIASVDAVFSKRKKTAIHLKFMFFFKLSKIIMKPGNNLYLVA
jgi:hypothetical protein